MYQGEVNSHSQRFLPPCQRKWCIEQPSTQGHLLLNTHKIPIIFHWLNIGQFILILIKQSSRGVISSFDKYAFHIIWSYEKYKLIMFFTFTSIYNTYNYCWSFHMLEVILQELRNSCSKQINLILLHTHILPYPTIARTHAFLI